MLLIARARNKHQIFSVLSLIEKGASKCLGFEDHYASSFFINEPIKSWITRQAIGHELDFSCLAVNENSIALSDLSARLVVVRQILAYAFLPANSL